MTVYEYKGKYIIRWRVGGKHHSKTFTFRKDAEAFDQKMRSRRERVAAAQHLRFFEHRHGDTPEQVYVVRGGDAVKIGRSADPTQRVIEMQTGSPVELEMIWRIRCGSAGRVERTLHERYRPHRRRGEWFDAEPVLEDLRQLAALSDCRFEGLETDSTASRTCVKESDAEAA